MGPGICRGGLGISQGDAGRTSQPRNIPGLVIETPMQAVTSAEDAVAKKEFTTKEALEGCSFVNFNQPKSTFCRFFVLNPNMRCIGTLQNSRFWSAKEGLWGSGPEVSTQRLPRVFLPRSLAALTVFENASCLGFTSTPQVPFNRALLVLKKWHLRYNLYNSW